MEVSTFFTRLLQAPSKEVAIVKQVDDLGDFDAAWKAIIATLELPDERQLVRGITSTEVPHYLKHLVDALVYESNRTGEHTTGACLEYFLKHDLLSQLEKLCESDRPHGIKAEVLRAINNLVVLLSEKFLIHNAVHRPLRRLLRSCVGDEPEDMAPGSASRVFGAAGMEAPRVDTTDFEGDLVDLMCILCSKMRAYPPLLLIFFHDKGWLQTPSTLNTPSVLSTPHLRAFSPSPSAITAFSDPSTTATTNKPQSRFEFLLFSYLLRFLHREGRIGDFARAGLLFLFDIAFLSPSDEGGDNLVLPTRGPIDPLQDARDALGEYILDGEFADVMAAGLGAIYSVLPLKLHVPTLAEMASGERDGSGIPASTSGGMHLGGGVPVVGEDGSSTIEEGTSMDFLPRSTDREVRDQLDLLLKLLGFLQDIITRCNSPLLQQQFNTGEDNDNGVKSSQSRLLGPAIAEATLEAMQRAFLDNVLYPAILECSPKDGSSVAVMTYLNILFSRLDNAPLLFRIIDFLLDTGSTGGVGEAVHTPVIAQMSPHRSNEVDAPRKYFAEEGRFTLKDLILDNIRSDSSASSTAAVRLLDTLLREHCHSATQGLLSIIHVPSPSRPFGELSNLQDPGIPLDNCPTPSILPSATNSPDLHLQELELYGSLISRLDQNANPTTGYSAYLADMYTIIQGDRCYASRNHPGIAISPLHRLNPGDKTIRAVFRSLGKFLCQTPDENVGITGVVVSLASCSSRSLAGWLVYDHPERKEDIWAQKQSSRRRKSDSLDNDESDDEGIGHSPQAQDPNDPFTARNNVDLPAVYQILRDIIKQIHRIRLDIDDFDRLFSERRQGLLFADHLDEAMNIMLDVEPLRLPSSSIPVGSPPRNTPRKPNSGFGGWRNLFTPTPKKKPTPSTTVSTSTTPAALTPLDSTPAKQSKSSTPVPQDKGLVSLREHAGNVSGGSPFKSHYDHVSSFVLETSGSPIASGPWSPARTPAKLSPGMFQPKISSARPKEADTASGKDENREDEEEAVSKTSEVSLSQLLDNVVILEEFMKEIVSVISVRRTLGIDQVGFI